MDHETSIRLASTVVADITPEQVETILNEYVLQRIRCVPCDGKGKVTLQKSLSTGPSHHDQIVAGTEIACTTCFAETDGHDPAAVRWLCAEPYSQCSSFSPNEEHQKCGYALVLPLAEISSG